MRGRILPVPALCLAFFTALSAQWDSIVIDNRDFYKVKERPSVEFPHARHMSAVPRCLDCHHRYERGANVLDEAALLEGTGVIRCAHCHKNSDAVKSLRLMDAYHALCTGCHEKELKQKKRSGPLMCGSCHVKKAGH